ncbi:hypothetical protein WH285_16895 [Acinetobacter johnsonii]|uniref:VirB4 family type IV secretion/conjugal transfer ATPase n=1 Tax=Acinetobacter johnsonii TaxID=40214 RepID=UPI0030B60F70
MFKLNTYRDTVKGLPDLLNFASVIRPGVVIGKDGALLAGYYYRADDISSASYSERNYITSRVNAALARFGDGWATWHDAARLTDNYYPKDKDNFFPDPISRLIDEQRRQKFEEEGNHFVTEYVLVISYLPPNKASSKISSMVWEEGQDTAKKNSEDVILEFFEKQLRTFEDLIAGAVQLQRMTSYTYTDEFNKGHDRDQLVNYLEFCITGNFLEKNIPPYGAYMDTYIGNHLLVTGDTPKVDDNYMCLVTIDGYPVESYPNILAVLETLPLVYRWSNRMIYLDNQTAIKELRSVEKKWRQKVKGFIAQTLKTEGKINEDALEMANNAGAAVRDAESGLVSYGYFTSTVVIFGRDLKTLNDDARSVVREVQRLGFTCRIENINSLESWIGTIPGHADANIRRPLIHTLNQSDLLPLSSVWAGRPENPCPFFDPNSPPLLYGATSGATPFRLNLHIDDVGHTLMIGPTGSGKSVALNTIAIQFLRYRNARIFAFDKGNSMWASSLACGGVHYDIGGDAHVGSEALRFAPLQYIDSESDFAWALDWLSTCFELQAKKSLTPNQRQLISKALTSFRNSTIVGERGLIEFISELQDEEIRSALDPYASTAAGGILAGIQDNLNVDAGWWTVFEIENLMEMGEVNLLPVLLYLFRRIEKSLDGRPTILSLDEAWLMLGHPTFRDKIREWLKVLRKANCSVVMATQSLTDALNSGIFDVLVENCLTKILLPNAEADKEGTDKVPGPLDLYKAIGLNDVEINILKNATRKRDYYYLSSEGKRLFTLSLDDIALAFVAANYKDNNKEMRELMLTHGDKWPFEWLKQKGIDHDFIKASAA